MRNFGELFLKRASQIFGVIGCIALILATAKIRVTVKQILLGSGKAECPTFPYFGGSYALDLSEKSSGE